MLQKSASTSSSRMIDHPQRKAQAGSTLYRHNQRISRPRSADRKLTSRAKRSVGQGTTSLRAVFGRSHRLRHCVSVVNWADCAGLLQQREIDAVIPTILAGWWRRPLPAYRRARHGRPALLGVGSPGQHRDWSGSVNGTLERIRNDAPEHVVSQVADGARPSPRPAQCRGMWTDGQAVRTPGPRQPADDRDVRHLLDW